MGRTAVARILGQLDIEDRDPTRGCVDHLSDWAMPRIVEVGVTCTSVDKADDEAVVEAFVQPFRARGMSFDDRLDAGDGA